MDQYYMIDQIDLNSEINAHKINHQYNQLYN